MHLQWEFTFRFKTVLFHVLRNFLFLSSLISKQLLDEVEQNIVIFQWQVDQLFSKAEG